MTRRDIIIIAVLANIGVLALLFMLALRTDEEKVNDPPDIAFTLEQSRESSPSSPTEVELIKIEPADELDAIIEEMAPIQLSSSEDENALDEDFDSTPPPAKESSEEPVTGDNIVEVTVKRGDALEKIARANGTTVEAIMKASKLSTDKLKIGQVLKVPVGTKKIGTKKMTAKPIAEAEVQYYTMKNGDNPWKIAKQFQLKLDELLKLNNLDEDSARKLKPGDQIRVR